MRSEWPLPDQYNYCESFSLNKNSQWKRLSIDGPPILCPLCQCLCPKMSNDVIKSRRDVIISHRDILMLQCDIIWQNILLNACLDVHLFSWCVKHVEVYFCVRPPQDVLQGGDLKIQIFKIIFILTILYRHECIQDNMNKARTSFLV